MMSSWVDYWDSDHAIYVNAVHKRAHAAGIAADVVRLIDRPGLAVLDYGCGEALYAADVAPRCGLLTLSDAAPKVRAALALRVASLPNVRVAAPDALADMSAAFDLIVVNSVLQYLSQEQFRALLVEARRLLAPSGRLVLADVIPPGVSPLTDATALLRFGWREGFLLPAVAGLVRTALSDYGRIRAALGFAMYTQEELERALRDAGFTAHRLAKNFGHNQARMAFEAHL